MNVLKTFFARIDAALDFVWIGLVLRGYHQVQAKRFSRKAGRLARINAPRPAYDVVSHQARRHKLEAELIGGKV